MTEPLDVPKYQLLEDAPMAPSSGPHAGQVHLVRRGSVISFTGPPGPHMRPLNQAARDKLEAWYEESIPAKDDKGSPIKGEPTVPAPPMPAEEDLHGPHEF